MVRQSNIDNDLLSVGDLAPSIHLIDQGGKQWRSEDFIGRSVVLVFHRHLH